MDNISCIIIEDEERAASVLKKIINQNFSRLRILAIIDSVEMAFEFIVKNRPDIVFLDVKLGNENGFDLLHMFNRINFEVIFTTAYEENALRAFDYPSPQFLLKPIEEDKLVLVLQRVLNTIYTNRLHEQIPRYNAALPNKLAFTSSQSTELIDFSDIEYLSAEGSYTEVHIIDGNKKVASKILGHYEKALDDQIFCRIHRKYIVNVRHIVKYDRAKCITLHLTSGKRVTSSYVYKKKLLEMIRNQASF